MESEQSISETLLKLLPFFKATAAYFTIQYFDLPLIVHAVIKCAPIVCLGLFVLHYPSINNEQKEFKKWILGGLALSCAGDFFLPFKQFFFPGMISFGLAHCMYLRAFGFKPMKLHYGLFVLLAYGFGLQTITKCINVQVLLRAAPIYATLLATMGWRSTAQIYDCSGQTHWSRICTTLGGILWIISDGSLGYDKFCAPLPHGTALIMVTYYAGQAGIALSVVDCWRK